MNGARGPPCVQRSPRILPRPENRSQSWRVQAEAAALSACEAITTLACQVKRMAETWRGDLTAKVQRVWIFHYLRDMVCACRQRGHPLVYPLEAHEVILARIYGGDPAGPVLQRSIQVHQRRLSSSRAPPRRFDCGRRRVTLPRILLLWAYGRGRERRRCGRRRVSVPALPHPKRVQERGENRQLITASSCPPLAQRAERLPARVRVHSNRHMNAFHRPAFLRRSQANQRLLSKTEAEMRAARPIEVSGTSTELPHMKIDEFPTYH